jgi:hypothetical protein
MRGLKKGKESEFKLAAQLLDVILLTLGAESEELYAEFSPVLSVVIKDPTATSVVRSVVRIRHHALDRVVVSPDGFRVAHIMVLTISCVSPTGGHVVRIVDLCGMHGSSDDQGERQDVGGDLYQHALDHSHPCRVARLEPPAHYDAHQVHRVRGAG